MLLLYSQIRDSYLNFKFIRFYGFNTHNCLLTMISFYIVKSLFVATEISIWNYYGLVSVGICDIFGHTVRLYIVILLLSNRHHKLLYRIISIVVYFKYVCCYTTSRLYSQESKNCMEVLLISCFLYHYCWDRTF